MVQDGSISQGAGGMHIFDLFTETKMKERGAKTTLNFGSDDVEEERDTMSVQGFGGSELNLHWIVDEAVLQQVEVVNLDGAGNYKMTIIDETGASNEVHIFLQDDANGMELKINGNISPENQQILAKNLENLNNFMHERKIPGASISGASATPLFPHPHGHEDIHDH